MAAVKLLLLILVAKNIVDVRAYCTPISLTVKAEYLESSIKKDYKHTRLITSSSSFRRNFDRLDVSASVSGSYGGFSAAASASFSEVSESARSTTKSRDETKTSEVTYAPGQNHIVRKISKTVTINGRSAKVETKEIVDVVAVKDSPSYSQLRKNGEDYIAYHYGGIRGGKIRKNVYTASACVKENKLIPVSVGDAYGPHRWKFIKNSKNANGEGWTHMFTFYTPSDMRNGARLYSVGDAHNPHRYRIFEQGNPTEKTIDGWSYSFEFLAYPTQQPGTIPYAVGDAYSPHRFIVYQNSQNANKHGWTHRFVFWAYPSSTITG